MFIKWINKQPNFRARISDCLSWDSGGSWCSTDQLGLTSSTAINESCNVLFYSSMYIKIHLIICHFLTYKYSFHHRRYFMNLITLAIPSVFIIISGTKIAIGNIPSYNMCIHLLQFTFNVVKFIQVKNKYIQVCVIITQQLAFKILNFNSSTKFLNHYICLWPSYTGKLLFPFHPKLNY